MIQPTFQDKEVQDLFLQKMKAEIGTNKHIGFEISLDKALTFKGRFCIPKDEGIRNVILKEGHFNPYVVHLGSTKITLKAIRAADTIVVDFSRSARGYNAIWVAVDHLTKSCGSWKTYLLLVEFAYNNSFQATIGMAPYEEALMVGNADLLFTGWSKRTEFWVLKSLNE
ncbi:uncharacterized protein LOC111373181 [Olea europaea var. sylvestris]|uniref:uncharacterized protein LOC111373181 n=1 Tax=Olea europaea var. sylvestris TaxID=158386 RepID=UPI000C1D71A6|nr:uncharacterized protein LOC111373181 [Olea europaea var. sylvestris]